jgi:hypothetical protein
LSIQVFKRDISFIYGKLISSQLDMDRMIIWNAIVLFRCAEVEVNSNDI